MKNKALIVISPTKIDLNSFTNDHFILGIERGCLELIKKNIVIDLAISDFDQVSKSEIELIRKHAKEFIQLNCEKDFLDGIEAIKMLKNSNFDEITMILTPTKRFDMNLSILEYVFQFNLKIINEDSIIFKLNPGVNTLEFDKYQDYKYISLFSKENSKISIKNLKYEISDFDLDAYSTRAFSNCFYSKQDGAITTNRDLLIIMSK